MSRFVSIFLPHLPIERLKRERTASDAPLTDDRPLALVGNEERGLVLTAVNAASLGQGLFPGLGSPMRVPSVPLSSPFPPRRVRIKTLCSISPAGPLAVTARR